MAMRVMCEQVQLLGFSSKPTLRIVQELMAGGSLDKALYRLTMGTMFLQHLELTGIYHILCKYC